MVNSWPVPVLTGSSQFGTTAIDPSVGGQEK